MLTCASQGDVEQPLPKEEASLKEKLLSTISKANIESARGEHMFEKQDPG